MPEMKLVGRWVRVTGWATQYNGIIGIATRQNEDGVRLHFYSTAAALETKGLILRESNLEPANAAEEQLALEELLDRLQSVTSMLPDMPHSQRVALQPITAAAERVPAANCGEKTQLSTLTSLAEQLGADFCARGIWGTDTHKKELKSPESTIIEENEDEKNGEAARAADENATADVAESVYGHEAIERLRACLCEAKHAAVRACSPYANPLVSPELMWRAFCSLRWLVRGDAQAIVEVVRIHHVHKTCIQVLDGSKATSPKLLHWACELVKALSWHDAVGREACHQAGATRALLRAMDALPADADIQLAAIDALCNLWTRRDSLRASGMLFDESNGQPASQVVSAVVRALHAHASDIRIARCALAFLGRVVLSTRCACCGLYDDTEATTHVRVSLQLNGGTVSVQATPWNARRCVERARDALLGPSAALDVREEIVVIVKRHMQEQDVAVQGLQLLLALTDEDRDATDDGSSHDGSNHEDDDNGDDNDDDADENNDSDSTANGSDDSSGAGGKRPLTDDTDALLKCQALPLILDVLETYPPREEGSNETVQLQKVAFLLLQRAAENHAEALFALGDRVVQQAMQALAFACDSNDGEYARRVIQMLGYLTGKSTSERQDASEERRDDAHAFYTTLCAAGVAKTVVRVLNTAFNECKYSASLRALMFLACFSRDGSDYLMSVVKAGGLDSAIGHCESALEKLCCKDTKEQELISALDCVCANAMFLMHVLCESEIAWDDPPNDATKTDRLIKEGHQMIGECHRMIRDARLLKITKVVELVLDPERTAPGKSEFVTSRRAPQACHLAHVLLPGVTKRHEDDAEQRAAVLVPENVAWARRLIGVASAVIDACIASDERAEAGFTCFSAVTILLKIVTGDRATFTLARGAHSYNGVTAVVRAIMAYPDELYMMRCAWTVLNKLSDPDDPEPRRRWLQDAVETAKEGFNTSEQGAKSSKGDEPNTDTCTDCEAEEMPLECAICLSDDAEMEDRHGNAADFLQFECGHRFCAPCVRTHIQSKLAGKDDCTCPDCATDGAVNPECPLCRRPLGPTGVLAAFARPIGRAAFS